MTTPTPQRQLSAAQMAEILALVQAQAEVRQRLTKTAVAGALAPVRLFAGWWKPADVEAVVKRILAAVLPAQRQAARVTDAYMARVLSVMSGKTVRPVGAVDVSRLRRIMPPEVARALVGGDLTPPRVVLGDTHDGPGEHIDAPARMVAFNAPGTRGADPGLAYGRIAEQYRMQVVSQGATEAEAQRKALVRIAAVAQNDVTMAVREQWSRALDKHKGVTGYRRILHPELTKTGPCGLCVVAADRTYKKAELLPLHSACACETLPILNGFDPGLSLNADDLQKAYEAAGGTGAKGLRKIRVALVENAETGPLLVDADQHYRSPVDIAKTRIPDRSVRAKAQLDALEKSYARLLGQSDAPQHAVDWQRNKIADLKAELAAL